MSATIWHRFPGRDLQALLRSLDALADKQHQGLSDDEKKAAAQLKVTVERGFADKQDGTLDIEQLIVFLEFDIVACQSERSRQLQKILPRLRSYAQRQRKAPTHKAPMHKGG